MKTQKYMSTHTRSHTHTDTHTHTHTGLKRNVIIMFPYYAIMKLKYSLIFLAILYGFIWIQVSIFRRIHTISIADIRFRLNILAEAMML